MSAQGPVPANAADDLRALLKVKKGSRFIPIVLLVVSAMGFVVYGLSSIGTRDALTDRFRMACSNVRAFAEVVEAGKTSTASDEQRKAAAAAEKQLQDRKLVPLPATAGEQKKAAANKVPSQPEECANPSGRSLDALVTSFRDTSSLTTSKSFDGFHKEDVGGWAGVAVVVSAWIKESVDILWAALTLYWRSAVAMIATAAAFALLPGLAGLFYRRDFWTWFGFGFAGLLAIHIGASSLSKMFGTLVDAGTKPVVDVANPAADPAVVELAASITAVLLVQLGVLLLAFRLRRHSTKPPMIASLVSPQLFNRALYWVLVIVAVDSVISVLGTKALWNRLWELLPFSDTMEWWNFILFGLPFLYAVLKITETWSGKRRKNIVVLLDGTSNTPDQVEMGFLAQTNVFKLFRMLKSDKRGAFAPDGQFDATLCKVYDDRQIAFYYTGIGNKYDNDPVIGTLSQATGMGASGIIERAYLDLIRVWRPGDRVFIFGFSRGAASSRILARTIDERGAPASAWTLRLFGRHWTMLPAKHKSPVAIDVLGCWDTVGSFGIAKTIAGINFQQLNILHDMSVPDNVVRAYHMVALDEERQEFEPTLMEPDPIRPERIIEVWFSGTHAGVGGGFATDRLSDVPLEFLLKEISSGYSADGITPPGAETWGIYLAARNGLAKLPETSVTSISPAAAATTVLGVQSQGQTGTAKAEAPSNDPVFTIYPDPRGQLRVWMSKLYNYRPRKLPLHAVIHDTVFERMRTSEPVYAPQALFDLNDALDNKRDHISAKVAKLDETKSLDAAERTAILEYTDKLRLTRWPQYWKGIEESYKPDRPSRLLENKLA